MREVRWRRLASRGAAVVGKRRRGGAEEERRREEWSWLEWSVAVKGEKMVM